MKLCPYCKKKWFKSLQALRAHLRFCEAYQKAKQDYCIEGRYLQALPNGHKLRYNPDYQPDAMWRDFDDSM